MNVSFYGGPKDGEKEDRKDDPKRGEHGPWASRTEYYIYDGDNRFVWSGTLEGHMLQAEVDSKRRDK